jgi:hypothetical protein
VGLGNTLEAVRVRASALTFTPSAIVKKGWRGHAGGSTVLENSWFLTAKPFSDGVSPSKMQAVATLS